MKARQFQRLAGLSRSEFYKSLAQGLDLIGEHVEELAGAIEDLDGGSHGRAHRLLDVVASEEAGKFLILVDAARIHPRQKKALSDQLARAGSHLSKYLYVEMSGGSPADLAEIERYLETLRKSHYLDGPNDVDWVFRNPAETEREGALYVDLIESEGEIEWWAPYHWDKVSFGPSPVLSLVASMRRCGFTTVEGLEIVNATWKDVTIECETSWTEVRDVAIDTLTRLRDAGLADAADDDDMRRVIHDWHFPLYNSDLSMIKVDQATLDADRERAMDAFYEDVYGPNDY